MGLLIRISRWIDNVNTWVGRLVAWTTTLVVLVVFVDVVMRYAFRISFVFTQELEWHLFAFIFLMGAGHTLLKDGHVRVDIIYQRMTPRAKAWINYIGVLLFLVPGCLLIIMTSMKFVHNSFSIMEGSPDPGGIPFRWVLKACIPGGFILILLQGVSNAIKNGMMILTGAGAPDASVDTVLETIPRISVSRLLFSFSGRLNRERYWFVLLTMACFAVVLGFVVHTRAVGTVSKSLAVFGLVCLWPWLAVQVKRWHDRNKSAFWVLVHLVPVVGSLWALIENGFLEGAQGDNRFGEVPAIPARHAQPSLPQKDR